MPPSRPSRRPTTDTGPTTGTGRLPTGAVVAAALAFSGLVAAVSCSSGLGNNLPNTGSTTASAAANLPVGLDLGLVPIDPIREPALAGAVVPGIEGGAPREVMFLGFVTSSPATDGDGAGNPLARDAGLFDTNSADDVFVAAVCATDVDTSAFSQSLAGKFRHPRCVTCHMMAAPDTQAFVSSPEPHAGPPPGVGFPTNDPGTCAPCHVNSTSFPVVGWQAPAASFDFRTKTVAQLAEAAANVPADEQEHFVTDRRVLWALDSGILPTVGGRNGIADDNHNGIFEPEDIDGVIRTVPGGSASFLDDIEKWNQGGRVVTNAGAVHDVTLVSRATDGVTAGNGASSEPSLLWVPNPAFNPISSASAQATNPVGTLYVVFQSDADDLVAGDNNGATDCFRVTIQVRAEEDANGQPSPGSLNLAVQNSTVLASGVNGTTNPGNGPSTRPVLGDGGDVVAFESAATNLVAGFVDGNGAETDVFVRGIAGSQTSLLSHRSGAPTEGGDGGSMRPTLTADGAVLAFASDASDLVAGDSNGVRDVFYADRTGGSPFTAVRASVVSGGGQGSGGASDRPSVSWDGAGRVRVAFESAKTDLADPLDAAVNVYLHDSGGGGTTTLLNQQLLAAGAAVGTPGDGEARHAVIAQDGSAVVFQSAAGNIDVLREDANGVDDIFAVETSKLDVGQVLPYRISVSGKDGADGNGPSSVPLFGSFAGASVDFPTGFAAYTTAATNLGTSDSTALMLSFLEESSGVLVDFTATPTSGPLPLTVKFTDTSSGAPTAWEWDFDNDGTIDSTERNPTFTYTTAGSFTVALTASNPTGSATKTEADLIRAFGQPAADFTASVTSGNAPLSVTFTDTSTEDPTAWEWDFDNDGTVDSTDQNPTFVYTAPGVYSVRLSVTGVGGTGTTTKTDFISAFVPVVADFSGIPLTGPIPLQVDFTDASTGNPTSWSWDFGDGSALATAQNPSHTYTSPGTYTVALTATGPGGADTETKVGYVTATGDTTANFTSDVTSGYAPATVNFTDTSISNGVINSWAWDFDNDGTTDSTAQNPSHIYNTAGVYTVKLTVSGTAGTDDEVKSNYFTAVVSSVNVDLAAVRDTTIYSESTGNSNGAGVEMVAGQASTTTNVNVGTRRAIVGFDVSSIPAGATITSAALRLTNTLIPPIQGVGSQTVSLFRMTRGWGEGTSSGTAGQGVAATAGDATWSEAVFNVTNWTSPGGDFLAGSRASQTIGETANTNYTWSSNANLVADVQLWVDTPADNHGWMLRGGETAGSRTVKWFATSQNPTASFRPLLQVTYQPPLP